jgi:NAD(P)H-dependent FMN reductase
MLTIIAGTNRQNSQTLKISYLYQSLLAQKGVQSQVLDLTKLPHDFAFSALYEHNGKHEVFNQFRQIIKESEKLIFIVPEYNGSFPGVLKTFIDGLPYPDAFLNKKAALVGVSSGVLGGAYALSHLHEIFSYLGMDTLSVRVRLAEIRKHFIDGKITNPTQSIHYFLGYKKNPIRRTL